MGVGAAEDFPELPPVNTKASTSEATAADGYRYEEQPLSPASKAFLHRNFFTVIACALEFQNKMDIDVLREHLAKTFIRHPRFRSKVVNADKWNAKWVPVEVDMTYHVREAELTKDEAADPATTVEKYMGRLISNPEFDFEKPLWGGYLVHSPRATSQSTAIFVIHHCLGDGTSLMSMLLASTRQIAHPDQLPNLPGSSKPSAPANATQPGKAAPDAKAPPSLHTEASTETLDALATKAAEGNSTTPSGLVDAPTETGSAKEWGAMPKKKPILSMVKNSLFHVSQFSAVFLAVGDTSTAVKRPPQASNQRQMIMAFSDTIPLAEMSAVRKACGTTINDVMMAVIALAVEQYIVEKHAAAKALPAKPRVTAMGLVNLRKSPGLQELSVLMDGGPSPSAPWGNKLGLFLLPLPIKTDQGASKKDPGGATSSLVQPAGTPHTIETLQAMKKMCDSKKLSVEAMFSYLVSVGTMELVGSWGGASLLQRVFNQTSITVSNMLGPIEPVSLAGNPITVIAPTAPPVPHSLCVHFQSYSGNMRVILAGRKEMFPDLGAFASCFVTSFQRLHADATRHS